MSKQLTARQREMLDAIREYMADNGYAPSIRELGPMLGISSLRGVTIHLDALEKKGWITRESKSRSIRVLAPVSGTAQLARSRLVPLLGSISAGIPLLAVENVETYVAAPPHIGESSDELFALRVRGDSMIGDHIVDGDIIVVRRQNLADHGDVVAALIGDEATVKRLDLRSHSPMLQPSNPNYQPIPFDQDESMILGKVVGLVRSFEGKGAGGF
jgi:repressor LexA